MIHKTGAGDYVISSRGAWLPGIYDSPRTARYAFRFPDLALSELSDQVCHKDRGNRAITFDDLRALRERVAEGGKREPWA